MLVSQKGMESKGVGIAIGQAIDFTEINDADSGWCPEIYQKKTNSVSTWKIC